MPDIWGPLLLTFVTCLICRINLGGVSLSKVERSSDQVIKPVNLDALSKWVGHIPQVSLEEIGIALDF